MSLINELRISGRVATEPTQQGKGPTKFRLAHGGGGKRKDGTPWPTQFFSVSVWDKGQVEGVARGREIEIVGKLRDASYVTKDGTARFAVEIVAELITPRADEPNLPPLTPDAIKGDTAVARAILAPASPNTHGAVIEDNEIPW
jgi:single-stranded DNA-binding protein